MNIEKIKKEFPLFNHSDVVYLDSGATTQKPKMVLDAVQQFYETCNANPHRGAYELSIRATEEYEKARKKVADFIHAKHAEEIIFSKNATESLNLFAYSYGLSNLKAGDEIILSIMEHHSNLVPWQMVAQKTGAILKYLYIDDEYEIPEKEIKEKITPKTKIVGITHVSNALGTINSVEKIISVAHQNGAVVMVDASQSIAHMPIDVQRMDCEFLAFSGHKMYAPLGVGVLYGKKELLHHMTPFLMGGDMIEYVYEQKTTFAELPNKFEAGTQNVAGAVGLSTAIDFIKKIGYETIEKRENEVMEYAREKLSQLEYITLYMTPNKENHQGVISFNIQGVHPHDVASILDSVNVCIRSGNHCAQPLMRFLKIDSTCRVSFGIYNTKEDVDRLIAGIEKVYQMFKKYM